MDFLLLFSERENGTASCKCNVVLRITKIEVKLSVNCVTSLFYNTFAICIPERVLPKGDKMA